MWPLGPDLVGTYRSNLESESRNQRCCSLYTFRRIHNDRRELSCLSKIAHMSGVSEWRLPVPLPDQIAENFGRCDRVQGRMCIIGNARSYRVHELPRVLEFPSTLHADLVRPSFNCEHAAQMAVVTAPKGKLKNPE
jgi:hypothetical protein